MRTPVCLAASVLVLIAGCPGPPPVEDPVEPIIEQVTLDEYRSYLRVLTGVDPVPGDPPYFLKNRHSLGSDVHVAARWLKERFESFGLAAEQQTFAARHGPNVVAELPGHTYPLDVYILCAHYDAYDEDDPELALGCDDNASGTAAVLLAARILARYRFDSTIRFIAFAGEEQSMVGSLAYAAAAQAAGETIFAVINLDMILHPGFDDVDPDPDHDLDIESDEVSAWLAHFLAAEYAVHTPLEVEVHIDPNAPSDHWSFWGSDYDAVGLGENTAYEIWGGSNSAYHRATDTMDNPTYEWDFALHVVRGAIAALVQLAGLL